MEKLLTPEEVAALLGMTTRTVWEKCRKGIIPCVRIGRTVRVRPQQLEKFVRANES